MGGTDEDGHGMSAPNFCPNCGTELGDPGVYCPRCGMQCRERAPVDLPDAADRSRRTEGRDSSCDGPGVRPADRHADRPVVGAVGVRTDRSDSPGRDGQRPGATPEEPAEGWSDPGRRGAGAEAPRRSDDPGEGRDNPDHGETPGEFGERVRDYVVGGWELEENYGDRVVLADRNYGTFAGHVAVFLLTAWFTLGLGNLAYAAYSYAADPDRMVLRRGRRPRGPYGDPREAGDSTTRLLVGAGLFLLGGVTLASGAGAATVAAGLFSLVAGAAVFPPVRRRLGDRGPVTVFGRTRETDERPVVAPGSRCAVCSSPVDRGVERTYRENIVAAGITLCTTNEGTNHYCRTCASGPDRGRTEEGSAGVEGATAEDATAQAAPAEGATPAAAGEDPTAAEPAVDRLREE